MGLSSDSWATSVGAGVGVEEMDFSTTFLFLKKMAFFSCTRLKKIQLLLQFCMPLLTVDSEFLSHLVNLDVLNC